jgi:hypothetical protein
LGGEERQARGLGPTRNEYFWVRERWAQVTNEALREAGLTARIDHRSLKNQGVDREPVAKIPQKVYYAERKSGRSTQVGDDIRARYRERVEARLKGGDELARVLQRQKEEARQQAIERSKQTASVANKLPRGALTRQELNQLKLEWYHVNKETVNQRRRERYRENATVERQKQREYWQEKAGQINERRRQWRKANAEKVRQQARERWSQARERRQAAVNSAQQQVPTAEESARKWAEFRKRQQQAPTAEESARKWAELRKRQQQAPTAEESARKWAELRKRQQQAPTAEESARKWLEFTERQAQANHSQTPSEERSRERGFGENADDDDQGSKTDRSRDNDYGL